MRIPDAFPISQWVACSVQVLPLLSLAATKPVQRLQSLLGFAVCGSLSKADGEALGAKLKKEQLTLLKDTSNRSQPEIGQYGKQPGHCGPCLLLDMPFSVKTFSCFFAMFVNVQESTSFLNAVPIIQKAPHAELAAQVHLLTVFSCLQVRAAATRKFPLCSDLVLTP